MAHVVKPRIASRSNCIVACSRQISLKCNLISQDLTKAQLHLARSDQRGAQSHHCSLDP
ncbi:unnamed protein product, partial [Citrullus colocynthis]